MSGESEVPKADDEVARLLRAMAPLETSSLETRVRARIAEGGSGTPFLRPGMKPRPAVWAGLGGVVVGAVVLLGSVGNSDDRAREASPSEGAPPQRPVAPSPELPPTPAGEASAAPELSPAAEGRSDQRPEKANASRSKSSPAASSVATENLLYEAARALRSRGDASGALRLLDEHGRRVPGGGEEALALRIEALAKLGSPKAKTVAERYLATYPKGRFRRLAEATIGTPNGK